MRELRFPKCPGCNEELYSDLQAGDTVNHACGTVSRMEHGRRSELVIIERKKRNDGRDQDRPA